MTEEGAVLEIHEVGLHVGIGDLIYSKSLLIGLEDTVVKVELSPVCYAYRGPNYEPFATSLARSIFSDEPFGFNDTPSGFEKKSWFELYDSGFRPSPISLVQHLAEGNSLRFKYACLNTKVRWVRRHDIMAVIRKFNAALKQLSKKMAIVIMGERGLDKNTPEYIEEEEITFSLYPYLDKTDNMLDLTSPELVMATPTIKGFRQDCKYLSEASFAINVGSGGNSAMTASLSKNSITFLGDVGVPGFRDKYSHILEAINPNAKTFTNLNRFLAAMEG